MKKSELRETIREEIGKILEQPNSGSVYCPNGMNGNAWNHWMAHKDNPQLGNHGISQNFINNMANRSNQFYNAKNVQFIQQAVGLNGTTSQQFCNGKNPMWQLHLRMRAQYVTKCKNNPGTCV